QGELDIVALAHTTLVFVEVKTRRTVVTGVPQAAVTPDKLRRLRRLAGEYLMERSTPHRDVRIDVVAVHAHLDGTFSLEHLEAVSRGATHAPSRSVSPAATAPAGRPLAPR